MSTNESKLLVLPVAPKPTVQKKRRKGQRDDGRSQASISLGRGANGRRLRKVFYGKTYTEAKEKAEAFKQQIKAGVRPELMGILLEDWVDICKPLYNRGVQEETVKSHNRHLGYLVAAFPGRTASSILPLELQAYVDRREGLTKNSIGKTSSAVHFVFSQAAVNGVCVSDPSASLRNPTAAEGGSHRVLENWESDALLCCWQKHPYGLAVLFVRFAGLRPQEAFAIDLQVDIDIEGTSINIDKAVKLGDTESKLGPPKTKAGYRHVPLLEPLLSIVRYVLATEPGRRHVYIELPTKGEKRAAWNAYGKIAGVESQQYDGRHTWATEIDDLQLVRDASLSYWMGHKIKADESITKKVYIHRLEARLEADKKKLQAYMAEKYKDFTSSIPQISGSQMVVKTEK